VFYLIPPNSKNLGLYEEWMMSPEKQETFLADQADVCFKLVDSFFVVIKFIYFMSTVIHVSLRQVIALSSAECNWQLS